MSTERLNVWSIVGYTDLDQMSVTSAIAKLQELAELHGPTARFGDTKDGSLELKIYRPETDAEMDLRLRLHNEYGKKFEERARAQYELLKARFEPK